jgi:hypothetical protein
LEVKGVLRLSKEDVLASICQELERMLSGDLVRPVPMKDAEVFTLLERLRGVLLGFEMELEVTTAQVASVAEEMGTVVSQIAPLKGNAVSSLSAITFPQSLAGSA